MGETNSGAQMMRAIVCAQPGPISVLKYQDFAMPTPEVGQVLIKIMGFGINRAEMLTRQGHSPISFPRIIGIECIGTVAGYHPSAPSQPWPLGTRVATCMGGLGRELHGSYAEYTCALLDSVSRIPDTKNLSIAQIASLPEMLQTTYGSLTEGLEVQKGESVLVRGATSSIGLCALTLARFLGASRVAGTTRSASRSDMLKQAGADEVYVDNGSVASEVQASAAGGFDKVIELVGTTTLRDSARCLVPRGTLCMTGIQGGSWEIKDPPFAPFIDLPNRVRLCVYGGGKEDLKSMPWEQLIKDADEGRLKLPPVKAFNFEEIHKVHEILESGGGGAKMVVVMGE